MPEGVGKLSARYTSNVKESQSFLTKEILNVIEESRMARLERKTGRYRELKRETVRSVRRDKESQVRGVCETIESYLWSTDSRPAYRRMRTLRSSRSLPLSESG